MPKRPVIPATKKKQKRPRDNRAIRQAVKHADKLLPLCERPDLFQISDKDEKPIFHPGPHYQGGLFAYREMLKELEYTFYLAEHNDEFAACQLVDLISQAVKRLNISAKSDPEWWKQFAQCNHEWPVPWSKHSSVRQEADEILKRLEVGVSALVDVRRDTKWNAKADPFARVALQLIEYVDNVRRCCSIRPNAQIEEAECVAAGVDVPFQIEMEAAQDYYDMSKPSWWREAGELPDVLCLESVDMWWQVARCALEEAYPHLSEIEDLARIAKQQMNKDLRQTPGRIKQRILGILKSRFRSLAGPKPFTPE